MMNFKANNNKEFNFNKNIKVSVCVITYNQEKYIEQCIESILNQDVDYDIEIIIGDDFSTDGTRGILTKYAEKYPEIIKLIFHDENIGGGVRNYISVHNAAIGKYIAHIDGDDYCLPGKLRTQSEFLDKNPACQIVWHRMLILNEGASDLYAQMYDSEGVEGKIFGIDDLISNITMGLHSSKMYRRGKLERPIEIDAVDFSENVLQLYHNGGYASFLGECPLGVYRLNGGISRNVPKIRRLIYKWLRFFYRNKIGDRSVIFAKLFLMILSDARRGVSSFWYGAPILGSMLKSAFPFKIIYCRNKLIPVSLQKDS